MKRLLVLLLIVAFFVPVAMAASRTWKSSSGRFSVEAELVGFKDGKVQLKKANGKVIKVPLKSLSAADQRYVKKQYPKKYPRYICTNVYALKGIVVAHHVIHAPEYHHRCRVG